MARFVGQAIDDGAVGFSTGLIYEPGRNAATEETEEDRYSGRFRIRPADAPPLSRHALHAQRIAFTHPASGERLFDLRGDAVGFGARVLDGGQACVGGEGQRVRLARSACRSSSSNSTSSRRSSN